MSLHSNRALVAAVILLALFLIDAALMRAGMLRGVDQALLGWDRIVGTRHPFGGSQLLLATLLRVTDLGGGIVRGTVTILGALLLWRAGDRRDGVLIGAAVASGALALPLLKWLFGRARPDSVWWLTLERHASFPSGHAMGSMILYPLLGLMIGARIGHRRTWVAAGIALALAIGATRVLLGVHWASDVVAGWAIGGAWALAALRLRGTAE